MGADSKTLAVITGEVMPVQDQMARAAHIQEIIRSLMKADVHFQQIRGTNGLSLTKQGSEMLLAAFHIAVEPEIIENHDADAVRYTIKITGRHMGTGIIVGVGVGRCSSNEEKYKWRAALCPEEFNNTPENRRRRKWMKDGNEFYGQPQVRTNPEDLGNTILKMAKKRAQVDLTLTCLAASDAFKVNPRPADTFNREKGNNQGGATTTKPPAAAQQRQATDPGKPAAQPAADKPRPATAAQVKLIREKLDHAGLPENHFLAKFEIGTFEELPFDQVNLALAFIAQMMEEPVGSG